MDLRKKRTIEFPIRNTELGVLQILTANPLAASLTADALWKRFTSRKIEIGEVEVNFFEPQEQTSIFKFKVYDFCESG